MSNKDNALERPTVTLNFNCGLRPGDYGLVFTKKGHILTGLHNGINWVDLDSNGKKIHDNDIKGWLRR